MMENLIETYEENGENFECIIACKKECQHGGIPSCHCKPVLEIRHKLHAYEGTGLTPEEITALTAESTVSKMETTTLKKALEEELADLTTVGSADEKENYTTGYRNGHRNGRIELIKQILKISDGAVKQEEKDNAK